jgi:hypothetical protein
VLHVLGAGQLEDQFAKRGGIIRKLVQVFQYSDLSF